MNKFIITLCTALVFGHIAVGQPITLRDSGFVLLSKDTGAMLKDRRYASFLGQPSINATWDMSLVPYQYPIGYGSRQAPPQPSAFPTAAYAYSGGNSYGRLYQSVSYYYAVDSSGISFLGESSLLRHNYPMGSFTGNPSDLIIFPWQLMPIATPIKLMAFPSTMGSSWSGTSPTTTQAIVYSQKGHLVDTPMMIITYHSISDTVVGWGKMRIRMPDSTQVSDYIPVLQIHETVSTIDSYQIAGVPVPDSILNYLGFTQGASTSYYETKFVRAGEIEPMLTAEYEDPDYTIPVSAWAMPVRMSSHYQTKVPSVPLSDLSVYPNPSTLRDIMISGLGAGNLEYRYALTSFQGRNIATGILSLNHTLHLPESLPAGPYFLSIFEADGNRISVPLILE